MSLSDLVKRLGWVWPSVGVAAGLAGLAAVLLLGSATRAARVVRYPATPELVRVAAPTPTPTPLPTLAVATAAPTSGDGASGGTIVVGDLVEVNGTGGDGVRLRADPDLQAAIHGLGMDSDVFQVTDGPVEAAGHIWWKLVNPYDSAQQGWAVAEFLRPLQGF